MNIGNLPKCCLDFEIELVDLLFPERMTYDGQEFVRAHGINMLTLLELQATSSSIGETRIKLRHRCQQLGDDGRCTIYENRPQLCRDYDCSARNDCACKGKGVCQVTS